jgi:Tfp pilus assembly protein PilX
MRTGRKRRGMVVTDAVIGTSIVASLLVITAITLGHDKRTARAAAEHRQLTAAAEAALRSYQVGEVELEPSLHPPGATVTVTRLADGASPVGYAWAEAKATLGKQHATLQGLVPVQDRSTREGASNGGAR